MNFSDGKKQFEICKTWPPYVNQPERHVQYKVLGTSAKSLMGTEYPINVSQEPEVQLI